MRILVCVKQVPDTTTMKVDSVTGTLIRAGVPSIVNPEDMNALEAALKIREELADDSTVTVLSMGPMQAETALRECLAMGADQAYLLCDRAFAGSDTWATSNVLTAAIRTIGFPDLILTGRQAIDGDTAQVGPQIAQKLDIAQVTYVTAVKIDDRRELEVIHDVDEGQEKVYVKLPALLTVSSRMNTPRTPKVSAIVDAFERDIVVLTIKDINLDPSLCGLKASPTRVMKTFTPAKQSECQMLVGPVDDVVCALGNKLREAKIVLGGKA